MEKWVFGMILFGAVAALGLSIYFSLVSFTGYVVSETIDAKSNWLAAALFLMGIFGSWYLIKNK